ncbi:hypothetical protein OSB04_001276 [Centaurea solstitialis]|uniref:Smr domain-containing protein n=1 Tax=Centaurea solstitialis TaxID=347529 RepID=A0AA38WSK6_9ASTR|nr:hypothetical protein OSB04_001276 [Centaurea solstitialis]
MKHSKRKKRPKPPISKSNQIQNQTSGRIEGEARVLNDLTEGIASFSIEEAMAFSNREDREEIVGNSTETASSSSANRDDDAAEIFGSLTETASSSSGSSGLSNYDGYNRRVGGKVTKGSRGNKVIAATGMVSTVIGKDYVPTSNRKRGIHKWKGSADGAVSHEDAEQFLCSMLSDDCELGMDLVKDVLCQSAYDVEKALDILLELTAPPSELAKSIETQNLNARSTDTRSLMESSSGLTDRTSDLASSSESDLQGNVTYMGCNDRNYFDVLASCGTEHPSVPKTSSELTQDVLESLFHTRKSSKHEPDSMNWRNVVKKMESLGQMFDYPSEDTVEKQQVFELQEYCKSTLGFNEVLLSQGNLLLLYLMLWLDSIKCSELHVVSFTMSFRCLSIVQAATAYASGKREYAAYLSDQGRMCNEKARQADQRASQDIFTSRNKSIENVITIDLHGQHVKQGMKLLKLHLLFGAYVRSVRVFRVITGCGSHGLGKSKLKQSVVNLLETENIEWKEENRGTLLIKLNGQREFSFLDSGSDSEVKGIGEREARAVEGKFGNTRHAHRSFQGRSKGKPGYIHFKDATAYASGKREYATYLSDQLDYLYGIHGKSIDNVITIDFQGLHVKQGMKLLKLHLLFGSYVRCSLSSLWFIAVHVFKVIMRCGSHGLGKSNLKRSLTSILIWNKNIENVITIDLHGQHVKKGMKLLKLHLLFGAYVRSIYCKIQGEILYGNRAILPSLSLYFLFLPVLLLTIIMTSGTSESSTTNNTTTTTTTDN